MKNIKNGNNLKREGNFNESNYNKWRKASLKGVTFSYIKEDDILIWG